MYRCILNPLAISTYCCKVDDFFVYNGIFLIALGVDSETEIVSDCGITDSSASDGKEGNWKSIAKLAVAVAAFASQLKLNFLSIIWNECLICFYVNFIHKVLLTIPENIKSLVNC